MSQPIVLSGKTPRVEDGKIGVSYSGGGPLVVVELGIARALIRRGIVPDVIAGVSAGSIAGAAHALDPRKGAGVDLAVDLLSGVSNAFLGLAPLPILARLLTQRTHLRGLGDNAPLGKLVREGLATHLGLRGVTMGTFRAPGRVLLRIAATDALDGSSLWFPDETPLEAALVASSAIPGLFPALALAVAGRDRLLIDGGVATNQPLSVLVEDGCSVLYACAVGPMGALPPPANALDNALRAAQFTRHQTTKLEEEYVRLKLGGRGLVHHVHPIVDIPFSGFDFTAQAVRAVVDAACRATEAWLDRIPLVVPMV